MIFYNGFTCRICSTKRRVLPYVLCTVSTDVGDFGVLIRSSTSEASYGLLLREKTPSSVLFMKTLDVSGFRQPETFVRSG